MKKSYDIGFLVYCQNQAQSDRDFFFDWKDANLQYSIHVFHNTYYVTRGTILLIYDNLDGQVQVVYKQT